MYRVPKNTSGVSDAIAALQSGGLVFLLSWQDVRQRYRPSIIGPFWITISNAILIGGIGVLIRYHPASSKGAAASSWYFAS
jgi:ABC-type polysaccharide/polyol phosphate export permease